MKTTPLTAALLVLSTALLASCANRDLTTGSIPLDYRERHPIVLTEAQSALDIPIGPNDSRLSIGMRDTIKGFAQNFSSSSAGYIQVQLPSGSPNGPAAQHLSKDIRATLVNAGIRAERIMMTSYQAEPSGDAAPVRLSYVATKAVTRACGEWPEDLSDDTSANRNWYNFGCASQNNLAAQVASPTDLIAPRGMTPIDAAQRSNVISDYRGSTTSGN